MTFGSGFLLGSETCYIYDYILIIPNAMQIITEFYPPQQTNVVHATWSRRESIVDIIYEIKSQKYTLNISRILRSASKTHFAKPDGGKNRNVAFVRTCRRGQLEGFLFVISLLQI